MDDMSQPNPLQFLRISIKLFEPETAEKLAGVVDQDDHALPLFVLYLYSILQLPVPPPLSTILDKVNV